MPSGETRRKLIDVTKKLLMEMDEPEQLTARKISSETGTNLAMINYYFKSKDELIKTAVHEILNEAFQESAQHIQGTARQRLRELLFSISKVMIKYEAITKLSIPYYLLNDEIHLPQQLLPFIRESLKEKASETQCRLIAFDLVYTLQLIFYRSEDFYKYCSIDIHKELGKMLDMQLNLLLGEE